MAKGHYGVFLDGSGAQVGGCLYWSGSLTDPGGFATANWWVADVAWLTQPFRAELYKIEDDEATPCGAHHVRISKPPTRVRAGGMMRGSIQLEVIAA